MAIPKIDLYKSYLNDIGITPRLTSIIEQLCAETPLPEDPLNYILCQLGCSLIPAEEIKALEKQVAAAYEELNFLRNILCDLGYEHECKSIMDSEAELDQNNGTMPVSETTPSMPDDEKPCCSRSVYG